MISSSPPQTCHHDVIRLRRTAEARSSMIAASRHLETLSGTSWLANELQSLVLCSLEADETAHGSAARLSVPFAELCPSDASDSGESVGIPESQRTGLQVWTAFDTVAASFFAGWTCVARGAKHRWCRSASSSCNLRTTFFNLLSMSGLAWL